MYILYLDEFGHSGKWDPNDPSYSHHPLFGLAGFVIPGSEWYELDRGYLNLKRAYYRNEIVRAQATKGTRPERYEPKSLRGRRSQRFAHAALDLVRERGGRVFAHGCLKTVGRHSEVSLYNSTVQGVIRQLGRFLESRGQREMGCIVLDRRNEHLNTMVLASSQSYFFGHSWKPATRNHIVEIPFLVRSEWHHGIQLADTIGRIVAHTHRYRLAGEQRYKRFDDLYGTSLDSLGVSLDGGWTSIYIGQPSSTP